MSAWKYISSYSVYCGSFCFIYIQAIDIYVLVTLVFHSIAPHFVLCTLSACSSAQKGMVYSILIILI